LGKGLAVPHAYCKPLREPVCAMAQVPGGMPWGAPDGLPVRLVFLLLSPSKRPEQHLAMLTQIARLAQDSDRIERLVRAVQPQEVLSILREIDPTPESNAGDPTHRQ
jgi:mannitol/fructose-specific phosphotransferase system IIA component (Ntr-type)